MKHHGCKRRSLEVMKQMCKHHGMKMRGQLHELGMKFKHKFGHGHGKFGHEHGHGKFGHGHGPFGHGHGKFGHGHGPSGHGHGKFGHGHGPFEHKHGPFGHHHGGHKGKHGHHHGHGGKHLWGGGGPGPLERGCFHVGGGPFEVYGRGHPENRSPPPQPPCQTGGALGYGFFVPPPGGDGPQGGEVGPGRRRLRRSNPCRRLPPRCDAGCQCGRENDVPEEDGRRGRKGRCCEGDGQPVCCARRCMGRRGNPCRRLLPTADVGCQCGNQNVPERAHSAPPAGATSGNEGAPGPSGDESQTPGTSGAEGQTSGGFCECVN